MFSVLSNNINMQFNKILPSQSYPFLKGWIRNFVMRNFAKFCTKITFVFREIFILFREISQYTYDKFHELELKISQRFAKLNNIS
jgi:hypothetical protein